MCGCQVILTEKNDYEEVDAFLKSGNVKRILLVYSNSVIQTRLGCYLNELELRMGIRVIKFNDFTSNPTYESVLKGIRVFQKEQCDFIIAFGGGSAIDVAKSIKLYCAIDIRKNFFEEKIVPNNIKLLAIPTTAGTGSEATHFAVIYYHGEKRSIEHKNCIPSAVLMAPSILKSLPQYQRKATMMDAFCHGLESFWSIKATRDSQEYSIEAIQMILKYQDAYLANESEGNERMLYAANLAGKAIDMAQTTAGHAMCYKITSLYGIAHGHAAALCVVKLWPYMISHLEKCVDLRGKTYLKKQFDALAKVMGCTDVSTAVDRFTCMVRKLNFTAPSYQNESELELLRKSVNRMRLKNNPVLLDDDDIERLYYQILK